MNVLVYAQQALNFSFTFFASSSSASEATRSSLSSLWRSTELLRLYFILFLNYKKLSWKRAKITCTCSLARSLNIQTVGNYASVSQHHWGASYKKCFIIIIIRINLIMVLKVFLQLFMLSLSLSSAMIFMLFMRWG